MNDNHQHVKWFRDSSPYINAHRGRTFVIYVSGEALEDDNFTNIIGDILLLNSLGIRLVLVHGATPQIDRYLSSQEIRSEVIDGNRITTPEILPHVQHSIGRIKIDIEAALSKGVVNSPENSPDVIVTSGNYVKAKPLGISDGVDFHNTGSVRKVNTKSIREQLDNGAIVLISPMGYSPSGEIFNIASAEVACEVAGTLLADKLILFTATKGIFSKDNKLINELQIDEIDTSILSRNKLLSYARNACLKGVSRCHLISYVDDGALLEELFTRDGSGTQIDRFSYEQIRTASADDVAGIIELIQPLESEGVLVKRSRELIESEIKQFTVIERDGMIVSCGALYPFGNKGELACLATHPEYRDKSRGELILKDIERKARALEFKSIFVLTTQTAHWFTERGFVEASISDLPESRQSLYNYHRNSKLFEKSLA